MKDFDSTLPEWGGAMDKLVGMYPIADVNAIEKAAKSKHLKKHSLMYGINLHVLWRFLFGLLIALSVTNLIIILAHGRL